MNRLGEQPELLEQVQSIIQAIIDRDADWLNSRMWQRPEHQITSEDVFNEVDLFHITLTAVPVAVLRSQEIYMSESGETRWCAIDLYSLEEGATDLTLEVLLNEQLGTQVMNIGVL